MSLIRRILVSAAFAGLLSLGTGVDARTWTDVRGRAVDARLAGVEFDSVLLDLPNGKRVRVGMLELCAEDRAVARQWAAGHPRKPSPSPLPEPSRLGLPEAFDPLESELVVLPSPAASPSAGAQAVAGDSPFVSASPEQADRVPASPSASAPVIPVVQDSLFALPAGSWGGGALDRLGAFRGRAAWLDASDVLWFSDSAAGGAPRRIATVPRMSKSAKSRCRLAFSPSCEWVFVNWEGESLHAVEIASGACERLDIVVTLLAVTSGPDGSGVHLWLQGNAANGNQILHGEPVRGASFVRKSLLDGRRLAPGGAVSGDGKRVLFARDDGRLVLLDVASGSESRVKGVDAPAACLGGRLWARDGRDFVRIAPDGSVERGSRLKGVGDDPHPAGAGHCADGNVPGRVVAIGDADCSVAVEWGGVAVACVLSLDPRPDAPASVAAPTPEPTPAPASAPVPAPRPAPASSGSGGPGLDVFPM